MLTLCTLFAPIFIIHVYITYIHNNRHTLVFNFFNVEETRVPGENHRPTASH